MIFKKRLLISCRKPYVIEHAGGRWRVSGGEEFEEDGRKEEGAMNVGRAIVGVLVAVVVVWVFVMKFYTNRIVWSAWRDLFKRRDK